MQTVINNFRPDNLAVCFVTTQFGSYRDLTFQGLFNPTFTIVVNTMYYFCLFLLLSIRLQKKQIP